MTPELKRTLFTPNWMPDPTSWIWQGPNGVQQGLGKIWPDDIGLANLLWLSLSMSRPPDQYDATLNPIYMLTMTTCNQTPAVGMPTLKDLARLNNLWDFHQKMRRATTVPGKALYEFAGMRLAC